MRKGRKKKNFDIEKALSLMNGFPKPGWRKIAEMLDCGVSYQTIRRRINEYYKKN